MTKLTEAAAFWEQRYADSGHVWSGRVNPVLADVAMGLAPGTALDLGCGEGGDAIWLAQQGWTTTGVDLSPTAIARAREAGADLTHLQFISADLATWTTDATFDLVTASFLHSWPVDIPREDILRRATSFVAVGGALLIVAHTTGPKATPHDAAHARKFPTPEEDLAALNLDTALWDVHTVETRERSGTGPDGEDFVFYDSVVLVQRRN